MNPVWHFSCLLRAHIWSQITAFLTRYFMAYYVRSLAPLTRSTTLCFTTLPLLARFIHRLACSIHGLAHSLCSLPCWMVRILDVFTPKSQLTRINAFVVFPRNTPLFTSTMFFSVSLSIIPNLNTILHLNRSNLCIVRRETHYS